MGKIHLLKRIHGGIYWGRLACVRRGSIKGAVYTEQEFEKALANYPSEICKKCRAVFEEAKNKK